MLEVSQRDGGSFRVSYNHIGSNTDGVLLDGDLNIGPDDTNLLALRVGQDNDIVRIDERDTPSPLDIGAYLASGGAGFDLTAYFQTQEGAESFRIDSVVVDSATDVQATFQDSASRDLLYDLSSGDRLIWAMARTLVTALDLAGTAALGALGANADAELAAPVVLSLSGTAALGLWARRAMPGLRTRWLSTCLARLLSARLRRTQMRN